MPNLSLETWMFMTLILVGTLLAHARFSEKVAREWPGILITTGIFATFLGIATGLYHFDVQNVEASLPNLIDGIRLAFWASVVGVGSALSLRLRSVLFGADAEDEEGDSEDVDVSLADIATHLKQSSDTLLSCRQFFEGAAQAELLEEIRQLRTEQKDGLTDLQQALSGFGEQQSEETTRVLVQALREAMREVSRRQVS